MIKTQRYLIPIQTDMNDEVVVSGRDLHEFLEVETQYTKWFKRMTDYGFKENVDFEAISQKRLTAQGNRTTFQDHMLKLDMAKELSMIQRTEKGKQARQYFITVEKEFNSPEKIMARALKIADDTICNLQLENKMKDQQISELKPKADYLDRILQSKSLVNITQIAKDYGMSAIAFNKKLHQLGVQYKQNDQWLLYSKYQDKGYTHSETIEIEKENGDVKVVMQTKWRQKGRVFLYELLKDEGIVPVIEQV